MRFVLCYLALALSAVISACAPVTQPKLTEQARNAAMDKTELKPLSDTEMKLIRAAAGDVTICKYNGIPSGYVAVSSIVNPNCGFSENDNAWVVRIPGQREVICAGSTYPTIILQPV